MKREVALTRERVLRLSLTHPEIEFTLRNADSASTLLSLCQVRGLSGALSITLSYTLKVRFVCRAAVSDLPHTC